MATTTTTLGLNTPSAGTEEDTWGGLLNANFDDLDDLFDGTTQVPCARFKEAAMAALAIDPDAGNIQTKSISTNSTFTASFADGDWVILHLTLSSSAQPTWPTITWIPGDNEPTLADGTHVLTFWQVNSVLYGAYAGPTA